MKKIILLTIIIILILILAACNILKESNLEPAKKSEEQIGFKIEKIVLSKGYQTIEPNVEIVTKNGETKLLVSLGLVECSGITIDKITNSNNEINIYTNRLLESGQTQLAIPQATIVLYGIKDHKLDDIKFNIVNENYKPIQLKFSKAQILNKVYSYFKISPNTIPDVNLIKHKDSFVWSIAFNSIFDKQNLKAPLVNLNVKADALTGEIISSDKNIISDYIDDGLILDYVPQKYLLYKQEKNIEINNNNDILWLYNLQTKEKEKMYETKYSIYLAKFSPDSKNISIIESNNDITDIYLINTNEKIINKITPMGFNYIWNMVWKNNEDLYFINNDTKDKSTLFSYNIKNSSLETVFTSNKNISSFDTREGLILFTEFDEKQLNQNIYMARDGATSKQLDSGYKVTFLDNNKIVYLKNIHDQNEDILHIYDFVNDDMIVKKDLNVKNYIKLNSKSLLIIAKNSCNNDYTLIKYDITDDQTKVIAKITGDKLFYDEDLNKGYLTLSPPVENSNRNIIYSIDLNKLQIN